MLGFMSIKNRLESLIWSTGFDVHFSRLGPRTNDAFQIYLILQKLGVDLVFDIGANTGQFAHELRSVGYEGRIVSFEPLSSAHQKLVRAAKRDAAWKVHPRTAIGDSDGEIEINIAGNSQSSSILSMLPNHVDADPGTAYVGKERVQISRLDSISAKYLTGAENYFLKIDTQGYEWQVLNGAKQFLENASGIYCELPLEPLYNGQHLWLEMIERLKDEGFILWAIQKGFIDRRDGRSLEINAVFVKP
ncbi:MAG: hypothetical protein RLZZ511_1616 [Cyanobacteriota bacterium]|jgi:FkbM family methyltransferase